MSASNLPMMLGESVIIYKTRFGIPNSTIYETVSPYKVLPSIEKMTGGVFGFVARLPVEMVSDGVKMNKTEGVPSVLYHGETVGEFMEELRLLLGGVDDPTFGVYTICDTKERRDVKELLKYDDLIDIGKKYILQGYLNSNL
jgi:hypothetical protein